MHRRVCLRLDDGTRIGCGPGAGVDGETLPDKTAVLLSVVDGFAKGVVTTDDLDRISDYAGVLESKLSGKKGVKRPAEQAQTPGTPSGPAAEAKRARTQRAVNDPASAWTHTAMKVVETISKSKPAVYFLKPPQPTEKFIPDYYDVIPRDQVMDLSTCKSKLASGQYESVTEFEEDLNRIWNNAITYNGERTDPGQCAALCRKHMKSLFIKFGLPSTTTVPSVSTGRQRRQTAGHAPEKWEPVAPEPSDSKRSRGGAKSRQQTATHRAKDDGGEVNQQATTWTQAARQELGAHIESIIEDYADQIEALVAKHCKPDEEGAMELDMQVLPDSVCWQLQQIVEGAQGARPKITNVGEETEDED